MAKVGHELHGPRKTFGDRRIFRTFALEFQNVEDLLTRSKQPAESVGKWEGHALTALVIKLAAIGVGRVDTNSTALEFGLSNKSKTSADYARKFDEGIAKLRASGRLAEILNKYGVQDWK